MSIFQTFLSIWTPTRDSLKMVSLLLIVGIFAVIWYLTVVEAHTTVPDEMANPNTNLKMGENDSEKLIENPYQETNKKMVDQKLVNTDMIKNARRRREVASKKYNPTQRKTYLIHTFYLNNMAEENQNKRIPVAIFPVVLIIIIIGYSIFRLVFISKDNNQKKWKNRYVQKVVLSNEMNDDALGNEREDEAQDEEDLESEEDEERYYEEDEEDEERYEDAEEDEDVSEPETDETDDETPRVVQIDGKGYRPLISPF